jgi:DEAD/DEAH box helicase domain-containing protein
MKGRTEDLFNIGHNGEITYGPSNEKDILFFDLETQRSLEEVGGRGNMRELGMSVGVTLNEATDEVKVYRENEVEELIKALSSAKLVVGFNIVNFDFEVLRKYTPFNLKSIPAFDMLSDIYGRLGFRVSLQGLAETTLGFTKSGGGLDAVLWYREGKWDKLIDYCRRDVEITKGLYHFGKARGYLLYWDLKTKAKKRVGVDW